MIIKIKIDYPIGRMDQVFAGIQRIQNLLDILYGKEAPGDIINVRILIMKLMNEGIEYGGGRLPGQAGASDPSAAEYDKVLG